MSPLQHNPEAAESSNRDIGGGDAGKPLAQQPQDPQPGDSQPGSHRRQADQRRRLRQAERTTRKLARTHYENFLVASVLLPRRLRQPFYNLYAWCRTADDLADESPTPAVALQQLDELQQRLDQTFAGHPPDLLSLALANTITEFSLPKQPFDDLLDAFRQDQQKTRYADFDELLDYCRRSANPVGRLVLSLAAVDDESNVQLSDQICTGLQLANFWQDVARDWKIGRIYLPQDAMRRHGAEQTMLSLSTTPRPLRELLAELCDETQQYFTAGLPLARQVPRWMSADVKLFAHGGLQTLDAIRRADYDVLARRPTVSKRRQLGLVLRALLGRL